LAAKRLRKELERFSSAKEFGLHVTSPVFSPHLKDDDLAEWSVVMEAPPSSVYEGEEYALRVNFNSKYPIEPPAIMFCVDKKRGWNPPQHEHIYSNGVICMSLLANDYSPALTLQQILIAIQSMLSSAKKKCRPDNDSHFTKRYGLKVDPRKLRWDFHDETC